METARRAVVIGVNKYCDSTIPELKGAENDAVEIHQRLSDPESGGFQIAPRHFLTGKDATCDAIREAISDLLWKTDSSSLSLLYFSGHGFHDEYGNGYIAPWDMRRDAPLVRGIRMQELTELLLAAKRKETVLLILDCCYSGIATEGKGGAAMETVRFEDWFAPVADEMRGQGKIILASAGKNEKAHELLECAHTLGPGGQPPHPHGAFTFHLLEGLDGKAATAGNDAITLAALLKYIETQMAAHPEHKPTVFGAGVRQADKITIGRASQWRKINERLTKARNYLAMGEPDWLFAAARILGEIIQKYATLPEAMALKDATNLRFEGYRDRANYWLLGKKMTLGLDCREAYRELQSSVSELCVDMIMKEKEETLGVLVGLCQVACTRPDSNEPYLPEKDFINQLKSYSSARVNAGALAKPEATAGKLS